MTTVSPWKRPVKRVQSVVLSLAMSWAEQLILQGVA